MLPKVPHRSCLFLRSVSVSLYQLLTVLSAISLLVIGCQETPEKHIQAEDTKTDAALVVTDELLCGPEATLPQLRSANVRKELKLTDAQTETLKSIDSAYKGGTEFSGPDQWQEANDRIQAVLLAPQIGRLNQICLQSDDLLWMSLLAHPKIQRSLNFKDDQKRAVVDILNDEDQKAKEIYATSKSDEVLSKKSAMLKKMNEMKLDVLTPDQKKRYESIKGEKFIAGSSSSESGVGK